MQKAEIRVRDAFREQQTAEVTRTQAWEVTQEQMTQGHSQLSLAEESEFYPLGNKDLLKANDGVGFAFRMFSLDIVEHS